ncbi:HU family DNA-binding protein [Dysgonomonas sp. GY617]|uniref:HU family DNA-binding protein n=1 Tax=Dysgonomonas sp. GY617 TaxID=2780420 RepID=UPI001883C70E|nr:HU family DNA-binding protein [Dysgonomonas sp. GY617]MBF0575744.1 HU family DNA-binding protein [Dysgonomonas sp. GY617]
MNKRDLIKAAAQRSGLTQSIIQSSLEMILETIRVALSKGDKISIHNFGTFSIKQLPERQSRNPKSGQTIMARPKKVVKFKATPLIGSDKYIKK